MFKKHELEEEIETLNYSMINLEIYNTDDKNNARKIEVLKKLKRKLEKLYKSMTSDTSI